MIPDLPDFPGLLFPYSPLTLYAVRALTSSPFFQSFHNRAAVLPHDICFSISQRTFHFFASFLQHLLARMLLPHPKPKQPRLMHVRLLQWLFFLCLAYLSYHNFLQVDPCYHKWQDFHLWQSVRTLHINNTFYLLGLYCAHTYIAPIL